MNRMICPVVAILACLGAGADDGAPLLPAPITAMTFNVRYGTANDGENSWEFRKDMLLDVVKKHDPDVLGLQECLEFQAEYLDANLEHHRWIGMGREIGGGGEMTALLYRHDLLSLVEMRHFWLSEQPEVVGSVSWDSSLTRMVSYFRFYHRKTHRMFHVFNTHFDHRGAVARDKSAEALATVSKQIAAEEPVIVMGDFNAVAESSHPWSLMINAGFEDTWRATENRAGPDTTWNGFGRAYDNETPRRIDWILTRGPLETVSVEVDTYSREGRYPSDHFPYVARLKLWHPEEALEPEADAEGTPNPLDRTR